MKSTRLTPVLLALDLLLLIALAASWFAPGPPALWRNWQPPAPQAPNLDDVRAAQLAPNPALRRDYPVIVARPLFAADRMPHAATSSGQAAAAPPGSLDQVKLYGLVDGPAAQGVLLEQPGNLPQFVRRGEKIGDWTLQAIEARNAIFAKGGERRVIPLPDSLAGAAIGAPSVSAPAVSRPDHALQPAPPPVAPSPNGHETRIQTHPQPVVPMQPVPGASSPRHGTDPVLNHNSTARIGAKT